MIEARLAVAQSSVGINWRDLLLGAVVGALVSALFAATAGVFARVVKSVRPYRALLGFFNPATARTYVAVPLHAPGATNDVSRPRGLPVFGYGPLMALSSLNGLLVEGWGIRRSAELPNVMPASSFDPEQGLEVSDLILVGWPRANAVLDYLLQRITFPIKYDGDDRRILIDSSTSEELGSSTYAQSAEGTIISNDCGLLARIVHPLNPDFSIIILTGCETFGVKIAAEALHRSVVPRIFGLSSFLALTWTSSWMIPLGISKVRSREFVAVVEGVVDGLSTGTPQLRHAWTREVSGGADNKDWKKTWPLQEN